MNFNSFVIEIYRHGSLQLQINQRSSVTAFRGGIVSDSSSIDVLVQPDTRTPSVSRVLVLGRAVCLHVVPARITPTRAIRAYEHESAAAQPKK